MHRLVKIRGSSLPCLSLLISKLDKEILGLLPQGPPSQNSSCFKVLEGTRMKDSGPGNYRGLCLHEAMR